MSIILDTQYPCESCKELINPFDNFCKHCGAKQVELATRLQYSVLVKRYGGDYYSPYVAVILTPKDALDLAKQANDYWGQGVFVVSYLMTEQDASSDLKVKSVRKMEGEQLGRDQGPMTLVLNGLE